MKLYADMLTGFHYITECEPGQASHAILSRPFENGAKRDKSLLPDKLRPVNRVEMRGDWVLNTSKRRKEHHAKWTYRHNAFVEIGEPRHEFLGASE